MMTEAERVHEDFRWRFKDTMPTVWWVACWLNSHAQDVLLKGVKLAPTVGDWREYSDHGDFNLGKRLVRCEAKKCSRMFTCEADWPFRDADAFIVMSESAWQRAEVKPSRIFITNCDWTHVATVNGASYEHWRHETRFDSFFGRRIPFLIAPMYCVSWYKCTPSDFGPNLRPPEPIRSSRPRLIHVDGRPISPPPMRPDEVPRKQGTLW